LGVVVGDPVLLRDLPILAQILYRSFIVLGLIPGFAFPLALERSGFIVLGLIPDLPFSLSLQRSGRSLIVIGLIPALSHSLESTGERTGIANILGWRGSMSSAAIETNNRRTYGTLFLGTP
jgi:hypothetical protein